MSKINLWTRLKVLRDELEEQAERLLGWDLSEEDILGELMEAALDRVDVAADLLDSALPLDRIPPAQLGAVLEQYDRDVIEYVIRAVLQRAIARRARRQRGARTLGDVWRAIRRRSGVAAAPAPTPAPATSTTTQEAEPASLPSRTPRPPWLAQGDLV